VRKIIYWGRANRLVYLNEKATPEFWDNQWRAVGPPTEISRKHDVVAVTRRYLSREARILEGGCGRADKVNAMAEAGFRPIGVDFAEASVEQARLTFPSLDIRRGDVRALDFPNSTFDGYWSIGVIEHFWEGYESILGEAARVLKSKGVLFLTAPWLSPYRRYKARNGGYEEAEFSTEPESFYQFALSQEEVTTQLKRHGFRVLSWRGRSPDISILDDMSVYRTQANWLLNSRGSLFKRVLRKAVVSVLKPVCGHSFLAVAQKIA
jgi:ubiquinone/menaquinone biosynthesis C-methylase UbiE